MLYGSCGEKKLVVFNEKEGNTLLEKVWNVHTSGKGIHI